MVVAALLAGVASAPALVAPAYGRTVAAVALGACASAAGRLLLATAVAAPTREPPALPADATRPTVSVVVTAYDEADVLAATDVDYPDDRLEVVVGYEAASTDGTAAVARAAAADDPRVTAVERQKPPGGKAAATNHALGAATGEVVCVLDADQCLEPDAVGRAVRWLEVEGVGCVKGRCLGTNPGASLVALPATAERGLVERTEFVARDRLGGFALFTGGQAFVRADALDAAGGFDESVLLEDLEMAYRLQRAGEAVRVDPGIVTRERNPTRLSAWWSQRKRWARGGMQVARRHLGANLLTGPPPLGARVDFAATLGGLLAAAPLALAAPAILVTGGGLAASASARPLWAVVLLSPVVAWYATLALDARDGLAHRSVELAAPLALWPYLALEVGVVVAAFVEEVVLRRPVRYVTS